MISERCIPAQTRPRVAARPRLGQRVFACLLLALAAIVVLQLHAATAHAFPSTGQQDLIVIPIDLGPHPVEPNCPTGIALGCPKYTAAEWQQRFNDELNGFFGPATWNLVSWNVRVLADPDRADGWWPAPHTNDEYAENYKNGADSFSANPPSVVGDAMENVLGQAIAKNVISESDVTKSFRFLILTNWHGWGGQSTVATYHPTWKAGGQTRTIAAGGTVAYANEDEYGRTGRALTIIEHELSHQLGQPDLYGSPCKSTAPGEPSAPVGDCVASWDPMGQSSDRNIAFGYYTRLLAGWVNPYSPTTRTEPNGFSGPISLSSIEHPDGDAVALHIPDDPQGLILARAFGNMRYLKGYVAECRRTPSGDKISPWQNGVLISYIDSSRPSPQVIIRPHETARGDTEKLGFSEWLLRPGDEWRSEATGDTIRFVDFDSKGGCSLQLNQPGKDAVVPHLLPPKSDSAPAGLGWFGGTIPKSVYANPGLILNGPRPPLPKGVKTRRSALSKLVAAKRSTRVKSLSRGRASTIRFAYGNAGKTGGGTATVRVEQPYVVRPQCGPERPHGRVVGRVKLPKLAAGAAATGEVKWRPRSSASAAVTVTLRGAGEPAKDAVTATSVIAFQTLRRARAGAAASAVVKLKLAVPRACGEARYFKIAPAIGLRGWSVRVLGRDRPIQPGKSRTVRVKITAAAGSRISATDLPLSILAGMPTKPFDDAPPSQFDGNGDPDLSGGIDLLVRVVTRGRRAPSFVVPPHVADPFTRATPALDPRPEIPLDPQSIAVATCSVSVVGSPTAVSVDGDLTPVRSGATVTLTYTPGLIGPPTMPESHSVTTNAAGHFTDTFERQANDWNVVASIGAGGGYAAASSSGCHVPVP